MIPWKEVSVTQMIYQSFKTRRQVNYEPNTETSRVMTDTPLNVGLGLYVHQKIHSKNICNFLSDLNLSVNYGKVRNIKSNLEKYIIKRTKENRGVYKPSSILEGTLCFLRLIIRIYKLIRRMEKASFMPLSQQFINNMTLRSLIYLS